MNAAEQAADILRKRVMPRLHLAETLMMQAAKGEADSDVCSLLYDTGELCQAVAQLLETDEMPDWKPELPQQKGLRLVKRIAAIDSTNGELVHIHFLVTELLSQEPADADAAEQDEA